MLPGMSSASPQQPSAQPYGEPATARERILETAYDLFSRHGVRSVGIDRIVAEAGVAKMSLYRHFASKDELVLAFLDLREQRWSYDWLRAETEQRAKRPADRLLVVFDVFDEWMRRDDYEGCPFIRIVLDLQDPEGPAYQDAIVRLENVRELLVAYATEAGFADADDVAYQIQILLMGSIVSASRGDRGAARRARRLAELLRDTA
jgi:AcrR family transcriptional regulator